MLCVDVMGMRCRCLTVLFTMLMLSLYSVIIAAVRMKLHSVLFLNLLKIYPVVNLMYFNAVPPVCLFVVCVLTLWCLTTCICVPHS